nr:MAG: ABC transporter permease [Hyphomicrobiales bacterium]
MSKGVLRRIGAVGLRHWYLTSRSPPRIIDLCYWPILQMMLWGFIQKFLVTESSYFAQAAGLLIAAVLLWDLLFRSQISFSLSFFEEVYSRNLGHLLATPLRIHEYALSLMMVSAIRTLIGILPATLLAIFLFGFSIYSLGLVLAAFYVSLIMFGWSVGLVVSGLVLRYGLGAEGLAWALLFGLLPFVGVYYPVTVLPAALQWVSAILPASYIFEGMRAVILQGEVRLDLLLMAGVLNVIWIGCGMAAFLAFFRTARERGTLLQLGE